MTDLSQKVAEAQEKLARQNPSVTPEKPVAERRRVPLSVPMRKLEVPEIPGFHLHWFRGTPQRLAQAEKAGYSFVSESEIQLNNLSLGGDATKAGNSDLGTRVSVIEGSETDGSGQAVRMYLMKQPMEYHLEDKQITDERNDSVAQALTTGFTQGAPGGLAPGENPVDADARYVAKSRTRLPDLFKKKAVR